MELVLLPCSISNHCRFFPKQEAALFAALTIDSIHVGVVFFLCDFLHIPKMSAPMVSQKRRGSHCLCLLPVLFFFDSSPSSNTFHSEISEIPGTVGPNSAETVASRLLSSPIHASGKLSWFPDPFSIDL